MVRKKKNYFLYNYITDIFKISTHTHTCIYHSYATKQTNITRITSCSESGHFTSATSFSEYKVPVSHPVHNYQTVPEL